MDGRAGKSADQIMRKLTAESGLPNAHFAGSKSRRETASCGDSAQKDLKGDTVIGATQKISIDIFSRRQKIEVEILPPEWQRFIEI